MSECSKWVTGAATATARLEVISAVPSDAGVPGAKQDGGGEQRATQRHAVDRSEAGAGRRGEQDLPISRSQGPPAGGAIAEGNGELPRSAFAPE